MTSTHLAFVELEFDGEDYDAEEERKRLNPEPRGYREAPASATVVSAWARPLVTALKLKAAEIVRDHPTAGGGFRLERVVVEFADGTVAPAEGGLSCPMQRAEGDSDRWDDFIAAIRRGSPYLTTELEPGNRSV